MQTCPAFDCPLLAMACFATCDGVLPASIAPVYRYLYVQTIKKHARACVPLLMLSCNQQVIGSPQLATNDAWYCSEAAMQLQRSPDQQVCSQNDPSRDVSECESAELSCAESGLGGGASIKLHSLENPATLPTTSAGLSGDPKEAEEDLFDMLR